MSIKNIDTRITETLRAWGKPRLVFWKWMAMYGLLLFIPLWGYAATFAHMPVLTPIASLAVSYLALLIIQAIIKRERPQFEKISGYRMWIRTYGFPSGHATQSTALALTLIFTPTYTGIDAFIIPLMLVFLAGMIMYSRIAVGVHYVTDILGGIALATLTVLLLGIGW